MLDARAGSGPGEGYPQGRAARHFPQRTCSPVDLPEHNIQRANDRRDIGKGVARAYEIQRLEMGVAGRADLAAPGPVAAIGDQVDAELTFAARDRGKNLARRHVHTLRVELEMVDQRL